MRIIKAEVAYLYSAHFVRFGFVFVLLPIIARRLGLDELGIFLFVQSLCMIMTQFVEFGYALSGTRDVVNAKDDSFARSLILSNALAAQASIFTVILALVLVPLSYKVGLLTSFVFLLHAGLSGMSIGWFFRAMQKSVLVAKVEIFGKSVTLIFIFLLVQSSGDLFFVGLSLLLGSALSLGISIYLIRDTFRYDLISVGAINETCKRSWDSFLVRAGGSTLSDGNVFICGMILSPLEFSFFASAYRISSGVRGLFGPLVDALLPRIVIEMVDSERQRVFVGKLVPLLVGLGVLFSLGLFVFASEIMHLVLASTGERPVNLLQVLALLPLIMAFVHLFGTCHLVSWGESKLYSRIVLGSGLFGMLMCLIMVNIFGSFGAIGAILLSYVLVALASYRRVWSLKDYA